MKKIVILSGLLFTLLPAVEKLKSSVADTIYRELYCNSEEELAELPEHFLQVCKKANVDPTTIHVYKTKDGDLLHCFGTNLMFHESFFSTERFYRTDEERAWGFAHELSHAINDDSTKVIKEDCMLIDFQLISSFAAFALISQKIYKQKNSVPSTMRIGSAWLLSNIAAFYTFFSVRQMSELRANDDASRWTSPEAGISVMKKIAWSFENRRSDSIQWRLRDLVEKLGFCTHGSPELQLARLRKLQKERDLQKNSTII